MVNAAGPIVRERRSPSGPAEGDAPVVPALEVEAPVDHDRGDGGADAPGILPLEVRGVRLGDLGGLRRLSALYRLNQPDSLLGPSSVLRDGLAASVPLVRGDRPAFVACAGQRLVGFAQFLAVAPDQRWRLLTLGSAVGVFDADPVWEALLTHAVRDAGLRGVKRLYARLPTGTPLAPAFRRTAWAPYATETVLAAAGLGRPKGTFGGRAQTQSDTWAIHQLYNAAVPRPVQDAEAYTSHRWELRSAGRGTRDRNAGWLVEEGHDVVGYARVASRVGVHVLELVVLPGRSDVLDDLLSGALAALPDPPARRVSCAVRGYQADVATALEGRGFVPVGEQELLVKYTTARVRRPTADSVAFHLEVRESLPQRVPSFLHGRPRDGSAN